MKRQIQVKCCLEIILIHDLKSKSEINCCRGVWFKNKIPTVFCTDAQMVLLKKENSNQWAENHKAKQPKSKKSLANSFFCTLLTSLTMLSKENLEETKIQIHTEINWSQEKWFTYVKKIV